MITEKAMAKYLGRFYAETGRTQEQLLSDPIARRELALWHASRCHPEVPMSERLGTATEFVANIVRRLSLPVEGPPA